MTTATVIQGSRNIALFQSGVGSFDGVQTLENGNVQVNGLRVFRSGSFRDSMGTQHDWEPEHMAQMVSNFEMLRDRGILPNVPVRDGHPSIFGGGGAVQGYITALRAQGGTLPTTGESVTFLVADFEFTEASGLAKWNSGTFRARSSEVGLYETNNEEYYWPVFQGFAFVDIPAVEGLYESPNTHKNFSMVRDDKENTVTQPGNQQQGGGSQQGGQQQQGNQQGGTGVPTPPANVAQPGQTPPPANATEQAQSQQYSAPANPVQLSLYGRPTTDFAAIQRHIDTLEQFETDTTRTNRENFVRSLASGPNPRMLASQIDATIAFAHTLDASQFTAWQKSWEAAARVPAVGMHGAGSPNLDGNTQPGGISPQQDEINRLEETVMRHGRAGTPQAQIEKMPSYVRLQQLKAAAAKTS